MSNQRPMSTQEYDGKVFSIRQPGGTCCESGCDGCELFQYKKEKGHPIQPSRLKYYQELATPKKSET